jgi:hypothetical protein
MLIDIFVAVQTESVSLVIRQDVVVLASAQTAFVQGLIHLGRLADCRFLLSGSKDNYILTDDKGNTFRLHSDKDINEHVGKMVEIRGNVKTEGVDSQKQPAAAGNAKDLDVGDIKSVSGSCPAAEAK